VCFYVWLSLAIAIDAFWQQIAMVRVIFF